MIRTPSAPPEVRAHQGWLRLVRPTGLVVAAPALVKAGAILLTSANLTEAALERNIEMGVLLRDPAFARTVVAHFEALIETGALVRLPAA